MEIKLLFLEIQVAIAVLVILLARPGMRKLPRVYSYMLWLVVFARLLVPVSFESRFSLMPSAVGSELWLEKNFGWTGIVAERGNTGSITGGHVADDGASVYGGGNVSGVGSENEVYDTNGKWQASYRKSGTQRTDSQLGTGDGAGAGQEIGGVLRAGFDSGEENGSIDSAGTSFHTGYYLSGDIMGLHSAVDGYYGTGEGVDVDSIGNYGAGKRADSDAIGNYVTGAVIVEIGNYGAGAVIDSIENYGAGAVIDVIGNYRVGADINLIGNHGAGVVIDSIGNYGAGKRADIDSIENYETGSVTRLDSYTFDYEMISAGENTRLSDTVKFYSRGQLFAVRSTVLLIFWAAGAAVILGYNGIALMLVKKNLRGAKCLRDNIYTGSQVKSPFTLGIISPKIYLPPDLGDTEREYIICHEQVHIRRKDYLVKNLAFLLTALHWFNPFVWAAFYFMERDMEMSCDEKVIGKMGQEIKKQYSQSLLNFAKGRCPAAVTPITFGENSVKQRVSNVLTYKTASRRVAVLGMVILVLATVVMFTVRSDNQENQGGQNGEPQSVNWQNGEPQDENLQSGNPRNENPQSGEPHNGNPQNGESWSESRQNSSQQDGGAQGSGTLSDTGSATPVSGESSSFAISNIGAAPEFIHASLVLAQRSPYSALEYWARAYTDRNGNVLFQLAADGESFKRWEKVIQRGDSFAFGESSPWPWEYDQEILMFPEDSIAEVTFHMRTSVPEFYLVKETVKVTEQDGLYYVDHESTWDNYSIETGKEYEEAYGQGTIFNNGTDNGVSGNFGFYEGNDTGNVSSSYGAGNGYAEMAALYDDAFYRVVLSQLLDGGNPSFYSRFTDPVKAAEQLLHLGAGTAEVTEWNMVPITQLRSGGTELSEETVAMVPHWLMASSAAGVGSQVIITYTFAKDGSQVKIPMELKEESRGIWGLVGGGIRKVYDVVSEQDMLEYDEEGHARGVYEIELSNYGIYRLGAHSGLTCLWAGDVGPEAAARTYENKLYIFESLKRAEENSEDGTEVVFVYDLLTGELHREHLEIPENYREIFPEVDFGLDGGFVIIYGFGKTYTLPLENLNEVIWNHKTFRQMSWEDQQAYGVENRTYLLSNPDTLVRLSVREPGQTSAFIDLDGDGESEQVILLAGSGEQGQYDGYYRLQMGESVITDMGSRLHNDIWAYSPDGKEIILALYEDGASADPRTYLFGYESGEWQALGQFEDDIRACAIKDGVISGRTRCEVIQTDAVYVNWQIGDSGQLEQVPQEVYDFTTLNDIELLEELPVQNVLPPTEEGVYHGIFYFTISPQTVRFLQTDSTFSWVYVEAEDGRRGWFQMDGYTVKGLDKDSREVFEGLWFYD